MFAHPRAAVLAPHTIGDGCTLLTAANLISHGCWILLQRHKLRVRGHRYGTALAGRRSGVGDTAGSAYRT